MNTEILLQSLLSKLEAALAIADSFTWSLQLLMSTDDELEAAIEEVKQIQNSNSPVEIYLRLYTVNSHIRRAVEGDFTEHGWMKNNSLFPSRKIYQRFGDKTFTADELRKLRQLEVMLFDASQNIEQLKQAFEQQAEIEKPGSTKRFKFETIIKEEPGNKKNDFEFYFIVGFFIYILYQLLKPRQTVSNIPLPTIVPLMAPPKSRFAAKKVKR